MIGELSRYVRAVPPQEVWSETVAVWKHGVMVLFVLTVASAAVMLAAALLWFTLNALPLLLVEGWTFERSLSVFRWTFLIWMPIAYSLGARHLPSPPSPASSAAN